MIISISQGITKPIVGSIVEFLLPPSFEPDSTLLIYLPGSNATPTTKRDVVSGFDFDAVQGPCLDFAVGDILTLKGHGGLTSKTGNATFTYDGVDLTCDGAGLLYEFTMDSGAVFAAMEGIGDGTNDTIMSVDGKHRATITPIGTLATAWGSTQDTDFRAMDKGYYTDDVDALIQWPNDPTTAEESMFQFEVIGDSTLTVDGTAYSVGTHTIAGLSGVTSLAVTYGGTDDQTVFTGVDFADVVGTTSPFSIDIDSSKVIIATMREAVAYFLSDTLTEASDILLSAHTPDVIGGAWNVGDGSPTVYGAGYLSDVTTALSFAYNEVAPPSADYSVTTTQSINSTSTSVLSGPAVRVATDRSGYAAYVLGDGTLYITERGLDGAYAAVVGNAVIPSFVNTNEYEITLKVDGDVLSASASLGGTEVLVFSEIDGSISAQGFSGIFTIGVEPKTTDVKAIESNGLIEDTDIITVFDESNDPYIDVDHYVTSPFAEYSFSTTSSVLDLDLYASSTSVQISVFVDGLLFYYGSPVTGVKRLLLAPGNKDITIINSGQSRPGVDPPTGIYMKSVGGNRALVPVTPTTPVDRLLMYGDSITIGQGSTSPVISNAWFPKVRAALPARSVAAEAWGYRSLYDDASDATKRAAFVAIMATYNPTEIWLAIGTNDYLLNEWDAVSFQTAYEATLDDLNTALPTTVIHCQSPIVGADETANGSGSTLGDYRTAISNAVATRTAFAVFEDGSTYVLVDDLVDGVHPNDVGHDKIATAVLAAL